MENEYILAMLKLLMVLGLMLGTWLLLQKFKINRFVNSKLVKVLQIVPIGPKEKIVLIQVQESVILLGATSNHIEKIHVFNAEQMNTEDLIPIENKKISIKSTTKCY